MAGFPRDHLLSHVLPARALSREVSMDSVIYLVGLIVVVMFVLSALGLH